MELTDEQNEIIQSNETRVILHSGFGTGKSTVMKLRAKKLAEENPDKKILLIVSNKGNSECLKNIETKIFFEDLKNVSVLSWDEIKGNFNDGLYKGLQELIDKESSSDCIGLFIDGFRGVHECKGVDMKGADEVT